MSDKTKVYQGVRVKITVKELLQRQRARQETIRAVAVSQNLLNHEVSSVPYMPDFSPEKSPPACIVPSRSLTENVYSMQMQDYGFDNQQMMNTMATEHLGNGVYSSQGWSQECAAPNMDYYSSCAVPNPQTDSFSVRSPVNCSSYSSPNSYSSSSSSSCYNSPTRMDMGCGGFIPDNHHSHCSFQHCYCISAINGSQDAVTQLDYGSYGNTDCWYSSVLDDLYFQRDSVDPCYL